MTVLERRRDRLVHVLDLARMYRGWTRQEVAAALGREPSKMIPESGNPKLDLVMGIARLLEWPVGEVADCLWGERLMQDSAEAPESCGGDAPLTAAARAVSLLRESCEQRRDGRYLQAIELLQRGMMLRSLPALVKARLQVALAETHCTLWHLAEARALASELIRSLARELAASAGSRVGASAEVTASAPAGNGASAAAQAPDSARVELLVLARSVRGHALRRSIAADAGLARVHAGAALEDLSAAERGAQELSLGAVAHLAAGACIECRVELGLLPAEDGVTQILEQLDRVIDLEFDAPAHLETWGWWCIYGANIARRHLRGEVAQRTLGILANKALEIAESTGDWALRERAFVLDHERRAEDAARDGALSSTNGVAGAGVSRRGESCLDDSVRLLDQEDIRAIIGTMGRFPHFREIGWGLLRRAVVVE